MTKNRGEWFAKARAAKATSSEPPASDPVTPEEYGLRAAKRQLKKDNASLVEQNLALRSKVSVLAAQVEALTSQLEESQAQSLRRFNQKEAMDKALEATEQRAQRAEEALLEVERCANGNASPEVLRRHVRRALSPTDPEEPDALT